MKNFARAFSVSAVGLILTTTAVQAQGTVPDHLLCYDMKDPFRFPSRTTVDMHAVLQPEFSQGGCKLIKPVQFCVPAIKVRTPAANEIVGEPLQDDYICYSAKCPNQVRPRDKVVTDQFGQRLEQKYKPVTVCVPANKTVLGCPVGSTDSKTCGGACPDPTQQCTFDNTNKVCGCTTQDTCGGKPDNSGTCGGTCTKPGEECLPIFFGGSKAPICMCQPAGANCGMKATGTCGGTCPNPVDTCALNAAGECTCQLGTTLPCAQDASGACGGSCPLAGQTCVRNWPPTEGCSCQPPAPCGQNPLTGTCGGACTTAGYRCVLSVDGECECEPPTCGSASDCSGTCPLPEQQCTVDATGACNCQPPPCGPTGTDTCGGLCPSGKTCSPVQGTLFTCACQ